MEGQIWESLRRASTAKGEDAIFFVKEGSYSDRILTQNRGCGTPGGIRTPDLLIRSQTL